MDPTGLISNRRSGYFVACFCHRAEMSANPGTERRGSAPHVRDSGANDLVMMTAQEEDRELRSELQKITETSGFNQVADVAALRKTRPHSISLVTESSEQPHGYNCFMYALGLVVLPDRLVALARQHDDAFPSARFMARLVERGLQNISAADVEDGDLVVYFDAESNAKHAGIIQGGYVVSKWGTGHLWKHQLFEIPASYGMEARFYRRIDRDEVLRLFEGFAQEVVGNRSAVQPPLAADDARAIVKPRG